MRYSKIGSINYSVADHMVVRTEARDMLRPKCRGIYPKGIKDIHFAFVVSIVLHLSVMLVLGILFSSRPHRLGDTVVADLTLVTGPGSAMVGSGQERTGGQGAKKAAPAPGRGPARPGRAAYADLARNDAIGSVTGQSPSLRLDSAGPVSINGDGIGAGHEKGRGTGYSEGGGGSGAGDAGGGGSGGSGAGSFQGEVIQGGSDYYYIRDTVMKSIRYPEKARRMGLEGKVVLSFIVLENGATREVTVINGSGFRVLDENAKETVEKTIMYKKMPHRVIVTLPITYKLQ